VISQRNRPGIDNQSSPKRLAAFPQCCPPRDPKIIKLIGVHVSERAALTMPFRPDTKDHAGDPSET
jgi:hypothetical protein